MVMIDPSFCDQCGSEEMKPTGLTYARFNNWVASIRRMYRCAMCDYRQMYHECDPEDAVEDVDRILDEVFK